MVSTPFSNNDIDKVTGSLINKLCWITNRTKILSVGDGQSLSEFENITKTSQNKGVRVEKFIYLGVVLNENLLPIARAF